jgi:hypothetical protein
MGHMQTKGMQTRGSTFTSSSTGRRRGVVRLRRTQVKYTRFGRPQLRCAGEHVLLFGHLYCAHTALMLHSYCTHTALMVHSYGTYTALILRSYCARTVLSYCNQKEEEYQYHIKLYLIGLTI